ncbi:MAG: MopE-related protein [Sandaracinus sp.]
MRTLLRSSLVGLIAMLGLFGCERRARVVYVDVPVETTTVGAESPPPQPPPTPPPQEATIQIQLQAGVTTSSIQCIPGAAEACNGLDDNCDGRIDEGCGWQSGAVQITLSWDTGADIDLYVTDPSGFEINYAARESPTGGILDHDARGACVPGTGTIENVYWSTPTPPRGEYYVALHYWGDCGVAGMTPAHVSISVGGRIVGVYDVVLAPGQRLPIAVLPL